MASLPLESLGALARGGGGNFGDLLELIRQARGGAHQAGPGDVVPASPAQGHDLQPGPGYAAATQDPHLWMQRHPFAMRHGMIPHWVRHALGGGGSVDAHSLFGGLDPNGGAPGLAALGVDSQSAGAPVPTSEPLQSLAGGIHRPTPPGHGYIHGFGPGGVVTNEPRPVPATRPPGHFGETPPPIHPAVAAARTALQNSFGYA